MRIFYSQTRISVREPLRAESYEQTSGSGCEVGYPSGPGDVNKQVGWKSTGIHKN